MTVWPDLVLLWEWTHDAAFAVRVVRFSASLGLEAEAVAPDGFADLRQRLLGSGHLLRLLVVDRASDVSPAARDIALFASARGARVINDPSRVPAASDKSVMHLALMSVGVHVPWTILLPPAEEAAAPFRGDLAAVGSPFVIKPAHGGGGEGVILEARTDEEVEVARARRGGDGHLVQERIVPTTLDGRPAYFRVLYCLGDTFPCFWHPITRRYTPLTQAERETAWGREIQHVTGAIAGVSGMDLFSTELAMTEDGKVVAVDYVNDMCDLRLASEHADGVPDEVVAAIALRLATAARDDHRG